MDMKHFAIPPEAPARVESALCSRYRCSKSQCAACAIVCPVPGAVRLTEDGAAITAACMGCGACVSACPNGAIAAQVGDAQLTQRIRERVRQADRFRISCSRAQGQADLVLPCLSRLTEALVLEPLRSGASRVELADPGCMECGLAKAAPQWEGVVRFAEGLCEAAGLGIGRIARTRVPAGRTEEVRPEAANPRRALFRSVVEHWRASGEAAAAHADEAVAAEAPPPFREIVQQHGSNPKRAALLHVLKALPGAHPVSKVVPAAGVPLARLEVGRSCVGCNVCETLCPVGALRHRDEDGRYVLEVDAALCTGCRVCAAACYHQAVHVGDTVDLASLFESHRRVLVSEALRTCAACHESFLDTSSEFCPSCRLSGDRREAMARRFFSGGNQSDQI